ncbi:MAG: motility associated factor glycosyltransferase family protein [Chlamydiia bacterium]|nr:motility associated factor glycosyltransferase family protein [Chlamydiia bacterium]
MHHFEENYARLMERFPQIALEMPAEGARYAAEESVSLPSMEHIEALYFYGLGSGEVYDLVKLWLHEKSTRRLIIFEKDLRCIAAFLHHPRASALLADLQTMIAHPQDAQTLVQQFPFERIEVAVSSSFSPRAACTLRIELLRKASLASALHLDRLHGYQVFQNFLRNIQHLPHSFYANLLEGKFKGTPAIICGAGPSLQQAIPLLKIAENKALIIAGGSTLAALSSQGISPHFGMAIDPNLEEYRRLKNSFAFEVPLLYSTRVFPSVFQTCNGPFGYMRAGIGGVPELWMEEELQLKEQLIGAHLSSDSISVTAICLAWAQFLGCNPIVFSGVDLAYTNRRRYASGVGADELFDADGDQGMADKLVKRKDRKGKSVYTAVRWLMESASFSHFASTHPEITFLNTTEGGIGIKGVPYCSLDSVLDQYCCEASDLRARVQKEIAMAPMPLDTADVIRKRLEELKTSLARVVLHLEVIAEGKSPGMAAIAELEMVDEIAYLYLFYDAPLVIERELAKEGIAEDANKKWERFLRLAKQYQQSLTQALG